MPFSGRLRRDTCLNRARLCQDQQEKLAGPGPECAGRHCQHSHAPPVIGAVRSSGGNADSIVQGGDLDLLSGMPSPVGLDQFGLVQADYRFGQANDIGVADSAE